MFEDSLLDHFIPYLQDLVQEKQEQHQRCGAEIISGIIRGSKHWSFEQISKFWDAMIPILHTAVLNMFVETLPDWSMCIVVSLEHRDPNRYHWLLEYLMSDPLAEQTSFLACGRITLLNNALHQQSWRNAEIYNRTLEYLKDHLSHPFQNVRERVSSCLTTLFSGDIKIPRGNETGCPRVKDFFPVVLPRMKRLYADCLKKLETATCVNVESKDSSQLLMGSLDSDDEKNDIRLFKTGKLFFKYNHISYCLLYRVSK